MTGRADVADTHDFTVRWVMGTLEPGSCSVHESVKTTIINTHVLNRGGPGVRSPLDALGRNYGRSAAVSVAHWIPACDRPAFPQSISPRRR